MKSQQQRWAAALDGGVGAAQGEKCEVREMHVHHAPTG